MCSAWKIDTESAAQAWEKNLTWLQECLQRPFHRFRMPSRPIDSGMRLGEEVSSGLFVEGGHIERKVVVELEGGQLYNHQPVEEVEHRRLVAFVVVAGIQRVEEGAFGSQGVEEEGHPIG